MARATKTGAPTRPLEPQALERLVLRRGPAARAASDERAPQAGFGANEFPGCRPVRIPRGDIENYERHFEYWDADTEIAWEVRDPTSWYHEHPSQRLAQAARIIAAVRGSPIEAFGTTDLLVRDRLGERWRILQADQMLFVGPDRPRPRSSAVEIVGGTLPDVVLEVDVTTDVTRGKLGIYESWGLPEVWVDVPDRRLPSSPNTPRGLTIHRMDGEGYRTVPESAALPTWRAAEIHQALNEERPSAETAAVLMRVGRALGEREGTGPDDDPVLGEARRESRAEGEAAGRETVLRLVDALAARDIPLSGRFSARLDAVLALPAAALMRAAAECVDEDDFLRRLGASASVDEQAQ